VLQKSASGWSPFQSESELDSPLASGIYEQAFRRCGSCRQDHRTIKNKKPAHLDRLLVTTLGNSDLMMSWSKIGSYSVREPA
jgi:hypothetical protein